MGNLNLSSTWLLGPISAIPQMAYRLVQPFCIAHPCAQHTDKHTDHAKCDIGSNRLHLCTACGRSGLKILSVWPTNMTTRYGLQKCTNIYTHYTHTRTHTYTSPNTTTTTAAAAAAATTTTTTIYLQVNLGYPVPLCFLPPLVRRQNLSG